MNKFGNWTEGKWGNSIVTDDPAFAYSATPVKGETQEQADAAHMEAYGGHLICESAFNAEVRRLICAAPEMYAAAKELQKWFCEHALTLPPGIDEIVTAFERAVASVEGRDPFRTKAVEA